MHRETRSAFRDLHSLPRRCPLRLKLRRPPTSKLRSRSRTWRYDLFSNTKYYSIVDRPKNSLISVTKSDYVLYSIEREAIDFFIEKNRCLSNLRHDGLCLLTYISARPWSWYYFHERYVVRRVHLRLRHIHIMITHLAYVSVDIK